jgi:signal transduction histidine kinase
VRALDEVLATPAFRERVVSFKIWRADGRVLYASDATQQGRVFPPTRELEAALAGEVVAHFDALGDDEDAPERATGLPLLEIYSPIREVWSGRVIAVAELYEDASDLQGSLRDARLQSWLVVGAVTAITAATLSGIVLGGSRTIERQQRALEARVAELDALATQNRALRLRVQRASRRTSEINERHLRRLSAELHDGPAQLLGFAALRVESLGAEPDPLRRTAEVEKVRDSLGDALRDLRAICRGLALPEIDGLSLRELLGHAVEAHRKRTAARVELAVDGDLAAASLPRSLRICVYRFVQEGLSNAWRHAGEAAVRVGARVRDGAVEVSVEDDGPGLAGAGEAGEGLGLAGLRDRVESLGGEFRIDSPDGAGVRIAMAIALDEVDEHG